MLRILTIVAVSTIICGCATPQTGTSTAKAPGDVFTQPYTQTDLSNGLRVIIVPTDYPDIVSLQMPVQTGSRNEVEEGKSGFAHFFEHMMFRGTEKYPADVYNGILKNAGADQNAYTTDDYTNYHITFTKADLEKVLELEADRFKNLKFSEADFRTEALAVKGEYLKNNSNPLQKIIERTRDLAFSKHTYQHTTMGFLRDIEDMPNQMEYAGQFFDRWYRPEKIALIVVGDVEPDTTLELVKKYFGDWQPGNYELEIPAEPAPKGSQYEHIQWEAATQPWLSLAFRGPQFDPSGRDMPAMDVISAIYFSQSSELYQKLVIEEQYVDQLFTYFPDRKDPYLVTVFARLTDVAHGATVRKAINDTIVKISTTLATEQQVEDTKSRLRYQVTAGMDTSSGIGSLLAAYVQFERDPETINKLYRSYDRLKAEDLRDVALQYFRDAGSVTVTLSNDPSIPGIDGPGTVDAQVAAAMKREVFTPRFVERRSTNSPLVDISLLFAHGAADDPAGKKGLANVTAQMIADGGSRSRTIQEINQAMYPLASGFSAQVGKEMSRFAGSVHRDNLQQWYALASAQLLRPGWRDSDLRRIKTQTVNAIRTGLVGNNDEDLGKEVLYTRVYGPDHPYGSLSLGAIDDVESITLSDVRQFYAEHYALDKLTIGLAGGYDDDFRGQLVSDLQSLPQKSAARENLTDSVALDGRRATIVDKQTASVAVSFGFPIALRRGDDDWVALWLARSFFGEHRSTNALLFQQIRERRGMNYGNYAYIEYFPRGMFQFHPDANLARKQQLFQVWLRPLRSNNDALFATRLALHELDNLTENGLTAEQFESTRSFLQKFVSLLTASQTRQLGYAIDDNYYGIDSFADYVRRQLSAMTVEDVNRVIKEHLASDDMQFVFVSADAAQLREALANDTPSPVTYESEKSAQLLAEDRVVQDLAFGLDAGAIEIVSADEVFR